MSSAIAAPPIITVEHDCNEGQHRAVLVPAERFQEVETEFAISHGDVPVQ